MTASPEHPWQHALVTGASSGIGRCIAEQLAAAGVATVAVARRRDRLDELADRYPNVEPLVADLETPSGSASVARRLSDPEAPTDLLVNNAGFGVSGNVADVAADRALAMIDVNVRALTELTRSALPGMVARRRGWILQVSSVASFQPGPSAAIYSATKAYVTSFTEALHEELRGSGVHVCALCPGFTRTEFHESSGSQYEADKVPGALWLRADDVARSGLAAVAAGHALDVPGLAYKGLGALAGVMPRTALRRVMGLGAKQRSTR